MRLYERALSPGEAQALFASAEPPSLPPSTVPPTRFASDVHRPRWHPLPPAAWTNEPHGLVHDGERWHLFYQANPNGPYWAQIQWGHLSSSDLVTWRPEPLAISPTPGCDERGAWSGDAVSLDDGGLALLYTAVDGARATVGLATSDDGVSFEKRASFVIDGRPEGFTEFRDPYVLRHGDEWLLIIGAGREGGGGAALQYRSSDLVSFQYDGVLFEAPRDVAGVFWEMPVLVPLDDERYAFLITTVEDGAPARALYWLGGFDGTTFAPEEAAPRDQDLFAGLLSPTVAEASDGRLLSVGIVPEARVPEQQDAAGWAHTFSLPRELRLCDDDGPALCQRPASELEALRGAPTTRPAAPLLPQAPIALDAGRSYELALTLDRGAARTLSLDVLASPGGEERTTLRYDVEEQALVLDRSLASLDNATVRDERRALFPLEEGEQLALRVFVDGSLVEVFLNDMAAFSTRVYPTRDDATRLVLQAAGGAANVEGFTLWPLSTPSP